MQAHPHRTGRFAGIAIALTLFLTLGFGSSFASAATGTSFHSQDLTTTTILAGEQTSGNLLRISGGGFKVTCPEVSLSGTMGGHEAGVIALHPTFDKEEKTCENSVIGKAQVKSKGCNYEFYGASGGYFALTCEAGHQIEIVATGCTVKLASQEPLGEPSFHTNESGEASSRSIGIAANLEEVSFTASGALCGLAGIPKVYNEAELEAEFALRGYRDEGGKAGTQQGLWVGPSDNVISAEGRFLRGEGAKEWPNRPYAEFDFANTYNPAVYCEKETLNGELVNLLEEKEGEGSTLFRAEGARLHPSEGKCISGIEKTSITATGCNYVLHATGPHAGFQIECEAGHSIQFKIWDEYPCTISVPSQTVEKGVTYANEALGAAVSMHVSGLHYTTSGSLCGSDHLKSEGNDLTLNSGFTLNAYRNSGFTEQEPLWVN